MKKILILAFALALSPALMAKGLHHSPKVHAVQKSSQLKPSHNASRSKAKPTSHKRTAKPQSKRASVKK